MNYFDLYSSYPDRTIVAAWDSQVKESNKSRWIAEALGGSELFARFAACYAELRELPRGARRSLQRRLARSNELAAVLPEYLQQGGRRLQHRMAWSLTGAALLLALGQSVVTAATITVTTDNPNIVADGQCSLIEAIVNANNDAATHADCSVGSGADTIILPAKANLILSAVDNNDLGPTGLPVITSRITIEGNDAIIARQVNTAGFRLIAVHNSGDLTLQHITLSGGDPSGSGGAIENFGILSIENSTISGNTANYGDGGGVSNTFGIITVKNSTISGNTTSQRGGAVNNDSGALTIENSTISGNTANIGGGLSNVAFCYYDCFSATLTIENSTISGNRANQGGGISNVFIESFPCFPAPCATGTLNLNNSLIAGNQATSGPEVENTSIVNANNFNLFGSNGNAGVTGFTPGSTDVVPARGVGIAQILGPLADNGGPTQTHALVAGSSAINAGNLGGCVDNAGALLTIDQRGFPRPFNGRICDIGSYESQADPLSIGATTLATGEAGAPFTSDLMVFGGFPPYGVSIAKGKLPAGLSVGNDGVIFGTLSPTARSEKFTVRITDSLESVTKTFTITVLKALHIADKLKAGRVGRNYSDSLKARGGLGPFNWNITSGAVPGLSFNNATGTLTGIPTQAGEFPLTVQVSDALGGVAVENLTLRIR